MSKRKWSGQIEPNIKRQEVIDIFLTFENKIKELMEKTEFLYKQNQELEEKYRILEKKLKDLKKKEENGLQSFSYVS